MTDVKVVAKRKGNRALPDEKVEQILKLYPYMKTAFVASQLGICRETVTRCAKQHGLVKDAEYMRNMNVAKGRMRRALQLEMEKVHPRKKRNTYFKKGFSVRDNMTEEQILEYNKNISEGRKRSIRKERIRINFGLPQKTKMNLVKQIDCKRRFKCNLKRRGYVVDEDHGIAYYNDETIRSTRMEHRKQSWFTFKESEGEQ